jgi:hypothetical protein
MAANGEQQQIKITVPLENCPIAAVTVYNDRAEVRRLIDGQKAPPGASVFQLEGLPPAALLDTIRVAGRGHSTRILDVRPVQIQEQEEFVKDEEVSHSL